MADVNEVRLTGKLARDPELKYTPTGKAVATISLATTYKNTTEYHRVTCWEDVAEKLTGMKKGDAIKCTGRLQTRSFEKDGVKKYVTEVIAWGVGVPDEKPLPSNPPERGPAQKPLTPELNYHGVAVTDEDIPF